MNPTLILISIISILIVLLLLRSLWQLLRLYIYTRQIPGPNAYPLIGSSHLFIGLSPAEIFSSLLNFFGLYPDLGKIWFGTKLYFLISKPEYFEIVLNHAGANEKTILYKAMEPMVDDGLITGPVSVWKRHRKLIAPSFNQRILNRFLEPINEHTELLLKRFEENLGEKEIDIFKFLTNCTLDIVSDTIMGYPAEAQLNNRNYSETIDSWMDIVFMRFFTLWYHPDWIFRFSTHYQHQLVCVKEIHKLTEKLIDGRTVESRRNLEEFQNKIQVSIEEEEKKPFLENLILLNSNDQDTFTGREIRAETNTFLLAGTDTTATALCFMLVLLGMHQDIQQKLYEEIIDILGTDRPIELDDLQKLKYTDRVIKESLRIFPSVAFIGRTVTEDINLNGTILPKSSELIFGFLHVQRSERYWPEPLKFNPDRFLAEECSKRHAYSWLPFSGGPRNCIGGKMAMMTMKCILAMTVRRFQLFTAYKNVEDVELKMGIVIKPNHGYKVSMKLR